MPDQISGLLQWVYICSGHGAFTWTCTKHLTLSHATYCSLYWRDMDLMAGPVGVQKIGWMVKLKFCSQELNIQVESNDDQGQYWNQHFLTTLLVIQAVGVSAPSISLLMTPNVFMRLTHWREGMLFRGTLAGLRSVCVNLMKVNKPECKVLHLGWSNPKHQ